MFHAKSLQGQLVMLQNSMAGRWSQFHPRYLRAADVITDEVRDLQVLCTNYHYPGPFASTFFEGRYSWQKYLPFGTSEADVRRFERASEKGYWEKYIGMYEHDPHLMGQIVHSISIIGAGWFGEIQELVEPASPGTYIPSYISALNGVANTSRVLVVGAFSPHSVADLRAIRKHVLPNADFKIVDLRGDLTLEAAQHYEMPFDIIDFFKMENIGQDIILTDHLVHWLIDEWDSEEMIEKREQFFRTCFERLNANGKIVMIESPAIAGQEMQTLSEELQCSLDRELIIKQLRDIGFSSVSVEPAESFSSRRIVNRYLLTGKYSKADLNVKTGDKLSFMIVATK